MQQSEAVEGQVQEAADDRHQATAPLEGIGDLRLIIRPSIGIAVFPEDGRTATERIGCADVPMCRCGDVPHEERAALIPRTGAAGPFTPGRGG